MKDGKRSALGRRTFLAQSALLSGAYLIPDYGIFSSNNRRQIIRDKQALSFAHFPSRLHALIWRNWGLVTPERLANTIKTSTRAVQDLALSMGLPEVTAIDDTLIERNYLTIIRRNWHLLPKEQLLILLNWDAEKLEFTLVEDDFFYIKLGSLKPLCDALYYDSLKQIPTAHLAAFKQLMKQAYPDGLPVFKEPLFHFVDELSSPLSATEKRIPQMQNVGFSPRLAYPYFALFGDSLLGDTQTSYPDAYLERMARAGVDSLWMHIVLSKLTPFPWDGKRSLHWEKRLDNLAALVKRAGKYGVKIYLYLNEPRNQPPTFFEKHPQLKGAGNSLCTSVAEVQEYLKDAIARLVERVPALGGFFSITASENPTNCWSHNRGNECPRCAQKGPGVVIAELNRLYLSGIEQGSRAQAEKKPELIVWDWGWQNGWAEQIIPLLGNTGGVAFMSVSEWDLPIERGGIQSTVGEYSISAIGPGPRATKHWQIAKENGIKTIAKIQANNSWELGAIPYIPAVYNVAEHISKLNALGVSGLMLGWSLGGYPSPNLEVAARLGANKNLTAQEAITEVAAKRYGKAAEAIAMAWKQFSNAFKEFPYHNGVIYFAPLQAGPSNLLWEKPTGYEATMVGLPYDDLNKWRSIYPAEIFIQQLRKVVRGGDDALRTAQMAVDKIALAEKTRKEINREFSVMEAATLHYASVANQAEFIVLRDQIAGSAATSVKQRLKSILEEELALAKRLAALQRTDSRIGFEASNHYFYVPADLDEKVLNCYDLLERWIPTL